MTKKQKEILNRKIKCHPDLKYWENDLGHLIVEFEVLRNGLKYLITQRYGKNGHFFKYF